MADEKQFTKRDYWDTAVSQTVEGKITVRGYRLDDLMRNLTFTEAVYLVIKGRLPDDNETKMLNAILIAPIDHQFISPPLVVARYVASGSADIIKALTGGLSSGGKHVMSPQDSATILKEAYALVESQSLSIEEAASQIIKQYREQKRGIPGLGHPIHPKGDPRAAALKDIAIVCGFDKRIPMMEAIQNAFNEQTGKQLPINVDGMMAAILQEMGFVPDEVLFLNILGILPGMAAQSIEEMERGHVARMLPAPLSSYSGEPERDLPPDKVRFK